MWKVTFTKQCEEKPSEILMLSNIFVGHNLLFTFWGLILICSFLIYKIMLCMIRSTHTKLMHQNLKTVPLKQVLNIRRIFCSLTHGCNELFLKSKVGFVLSFCSPVLPVKFKDGDTVSVKQLLVHSAVVSIVHFIDTLQLPGFIFSSVLFLFFFSDFIITC